MSEKNVEIEDNMKISENIDNNGENNNMKISEENIEIKRNLSECEQYDKSLKVIVLGDSYVGKSSLINRLLHNQFSELSSTLSIEYHTYITSVNNYKLRMQIWDTAGQEKFNSIISNYYKGTDVGIFLYSIDKEQSFQNVEMWYKNLKENNENTLNILIGNKRDMENEEGGRVITFERAEKFAEDNSFYAFREISCKSKDEEEVENIYEIFDEIGKYFYEESKKNKNNNKNDNNADINYVVSESMMALGKKKKIKKENEQDKNKKKCC
jgi:small GTP-binding protein